MIPLLGLFLLAGVLLARAEEKRLWRADFESAPAFLDVSGGGWQIADGVCQGRESSGDHGSFFFAPAARSLEGGRFEALISWEERLSSRGWASAGLCLRGAAGDLWMLAFTEGPGKERYVDFLESFQGSWQAQGAGDTRLDLSGESGGKFSWSPGIVYRLRIDLSEEGISGSVSDPAGKPLWRRAFRFGKAPALRSGRPALLVRGCAARFEEAEVFSALPLGLRFREIPMARGPSGSLALLQDAFQGPGWAESGAALAEALRQRDWGVTVLNGQDVCDPAVLHPAQVPLLVVPSAPIYPRDGQAALARYLSHGGRVLFLGAPPLSLPVARMEGEWLDRSGYGSRLAQIRPEKELAGGASAALAWSLAAKSRACGATFAPGIESPGQPAWRYQVKNLDGWAVYRTPGLPGMFSGGQDLLCLRVKGDSGTPALTVELEERDGSRWMAGVPLTETWEWRVLPVSHFRFWPDSPQGIGRGEAGDHCRAAEVTRLALGLIEGQDGVEAGRGGFWLSSLGTAKNPLGEFPSVDPSLVIESVSPSYKLYPCRELARFRAAGAAIPGLKPDLMPRGEIWSPLPRPGAEGFGRQRQWRLLPILEALDSQGVCRGSPAWMLAWLEGERRGALVGCLGVNDAAFFRTPSGIALTGELVRRMSVSCLLAEGGADTFTAAAGEPVRVGAQVMPCGLWSGKAAVRLAVSTGEALQVEHRAEMDLVPGASGEVSWELPPELRQPGTRRVRVELTDPSGPGPVDVLEHEVCLEPPRAQPAARDFVRVRDGEFIVADQPWRIQGINYWPRYVSGMEVDDYNRAWLSSKSYDPRQVEADLSLMEELGINLVSVMLGGPPDCANLRDFFRRCRAHSIRVNAFIGAASPVNFREQELRFIIENGGLRDEPALFAYDIIWEPGNHLFNDEGRPRWDADWARWVEERYGSLAAAEKDWGFPAPRREGRLASPSGEQMREDGPWRVFVAAYRRFMDDFTSRKWNDAVRRLRAIDPHHLIGFRQGNTLPQDFALTGPVKHVDFISPEGYAITDLERGEDVAGFITRYIKMTSGGKPVYWAEFGRSVWDGERMRADPALVEKQGQYSALFHRMAVWSDAQGVAPWWWPGGYRVNERSDFGILDPDGRPRPAARLFREHGPALRARGGPLAPVEWLEVDRDAHPGGYWHIAFHEGWEACRRARLAGKVLGVRTAGTGTTSASAPLVAVGNVPCHGSNPPKFLNAEFNELQIRDSEGVWREVLPAGENRIPVRAGQPLRVRASVGNLGQAAWLPPGPGLGQGAVYLSSRQGEPGFQQPIPSSVPSLGDAEFGEFDLPALVPGEREIVFEMTAAQRCWFGEKRKAALEAR